MAVNFSVSGFPRIHLSNSVDQMLTYLDPHCLQDSLIDLFYSYKKGKYKPG